MTFRYRQKIQGHAILVSPHHPKHREVSQMSQTPSQIRNDELAKWRAQVINDLRDLAALLKITTHEQFPTPNLYISHYSIDEPTDEDIYASRNLTFDDVRRFMSITPGNWHKYASQGSMTYSKAIGDSIRVTFHVDRSATCERVQVGTKHVEATEAHDEPVYEWRCNDAEPTV